MNTTLMTTARANLDKLVRWPRDVYQNLLKTANDLPMINYRMGCDFADQGLFRDAIFRLKVTLWFTPGFARAWYVLGTCYLARGETTQAAAAFGEALRLEPGNEDTLFMLAMVHPRYVPEDKRPKTMPRKMAMDYFQRIAEGYEFQQREMGYTGHVHADAALRPLLDTRRVNYHLLDMGCGTGLTGFMLSDVAGRMTGVDFCRAMLDHAMKRRSRTGEEVYSRTILRDIRDYLLEIQEPEYDIVTAAHVFNFVGDLSAVFPGVARALHPGGLFVFQVEPYAGQGFALLAGLGRFGHSEAYINGLIQANGFERVEMKKVNVYPNYPLDQYVLRKRGADADSGE